jgi:hypothetical protein
MAFLLRLKSGFASSLVVWTVRRKDERPAALRWRAVDPMMKGWCLELPLVDVQRAGGTPSSSSRWAWFIVQRM